MGSNPNQIRNSENDEIDRISDLPDPILSQILSHLPTKFAVGASVLSKRWKNVSPFGVPPVILDLDDSLFLNPTQDIIDQSNNKNPSLTFVDFVDKLFNKTLFDDVPCVEEMELKCDKNYDDSKIVSWVCAALRLKVQRLSLEFALNDSETLFHGLSGCTTLVTLWLYLDSKLCLPADFILPNLKLLELLKVEFGDDDSEGPSINELIEGCPALEDLRLFGCNSQSLEFLIIKSPQLKKLTIVSSLVESTCVVLIEAPNLEIFIYNDCVATLYFASEFKSLRAAHIDVGPSQEQRDLYDEDIDDDGLWYWHDTASLVSVCSNTIYLYLAARSIDVLQHTFTRLPVFQNLTCLSLGCLGTHWAILAHLLGNAPNLEVLTIEEGFAENEEGFANFENSLSGPPICLELHMKIIEFWVFRGEDDEIKLIEYFLKNGKVLEKVVLYCLPFQNIETFRRLFLLPKQSRSCHVELQRRR